MSIALIYPHQLYDKHPALRGADACVLVEEPLFFTQYCFHAKKLVLHRASMRVYAEKLRKEGRDVRYVECSELSNTGAIAEVLTTLAATDVQFVAPCDDWLGNRLAASLKSAGIGYRIIDDPHVLTSETVFKDYAYGRQKLYFTDFYRFQRRRLRVLVDKHDKPVGGKWSFDTDNRKKLPRSVEVPCLRWPRRLPEVTEAQNYVATNFPGALGEAHGFAYPVTHEQAEHWLADFLDERLADFGQYEDAISENEAFLFHSVLAPILNIGLLSPRQVLNAALERVEEVPLSSLEGFVRQVIGWREFVRGVYLTAGRRQRTRNFWKHSRPMPAAFYDATTGVTPVDAVINRVLTHAYCHHIERLMILGNFMMLCEIHPDAIYQWFMEMYIDAYDWVMVPNVYGMSQHSDGGLMTTKPYISASSYVRKMSNFRKGPWCEIWDGLYWRFVASHREFFAANPRTSVMVAQLNKMGSRLDRHQHIADAYLTNLWGASSPHVL